MISIKQLIEQVVSSELEGLKEDLQVRQAFANDLVSMGLGDEDSADIHGQDTDSTKKKISLGRPIKQLFHKYADRNWLNTLVTIHTFSGTRDLTELSSGMSSKDELSCMAFEPGKFPSRLAFGNFALVVKGHISLLANDMDDLFTGSGYAYREANPERSQHSGTNKGIAKRRRAEEYADELDAILVFDKEDWQSYSNNEALVDNWNPIALVMDTSRYDVQVAERKIEAVKNILAKTRFDIPVLSIDEAQKIF